MDTGQDNGIVFDPSSGISEEEQREIAAGIDSLAEKNRRALSAGKPPLAAKKRGVLFPSLVNAAGVLLLAGGIFLLYILHGNEEVQIREGPQVYNTAERALIREIRKDTALQLEAKENEISQIVSKLEGVDSELLDLQSSVEMTEKEIELRKAALQNLQEEYRTNLSFLEGQRAQILEASHVREAALRTQLEARTKELTAVSEQNQALASARNELERLSGEQEKAGVIEAQLGGYYALADEQIRKGQYREASDTVAAAKEFLNTPGFQGIRPVQARKEIYAAAIAGLEGVIEALRSGEGRDAGSNDAAIADLQTRNTRLEESVAELNRTIQSYTLQGSDLDKRITEYESSISSLKAQTAALEQSAADRDLMIAELNSQNGALTQTVSSRDARIAELNTQNAAYLKEIEDLRGRITTIQQALQALSQ